MRKEELISMEDKLFNAMNGIVTTTQLLQHGFDLPDDAIKLLEIQESSSVRLEEEIRALFAKISSNCSSNGLSA